MRMAQVDKKQQETVRRIVRIMRGNPVYVIVAAIAAVVFIGACALGVLQADGVVIERDDEAAAEVIDGALDAVGDALEEKAEGHNESEPSEDAEEAPKDSSPAETAPTDEAQTVTPSYIVVDVTGAVLNPSVVTLPAGSRVNDAIQAAGGLMNDADTTAINRAKTLSDGEQVFVPTQGEAAPAPAETGTPAASSSEATSSSGEPAIVNINTASVDELDTLPGVGPSTAQAIVDDRTQNGPFASTEDLMRVSGIGEKKFEKLLSLICV